MEEAEAGEAPDCRQRLEMSPAGVWHHGRKVMVIMLLGGQGKGNVGCRLLGFPIIPEDWTRFEKVIE